MFRRTVGGAATTTRSWTRLGAKPAELSFEEAAGLPVAIETPVRIFDVLGGPGEDQTIVINTAAGGVGDIAVQEAKGPRRTRDRHRSARDHESLRELATEPTTCGDGLAELVRELAPEGRDGADTALRSRGQRAGASRSSRTWPRLGRDVDVRCGVARSGRRPLPNTSVRWLLTRCWLQRLSEA